MLTERDLRQALFCAVEERQARERGKTPGLARWNDELIQALYGELTALSRPRQSEDVESSNLAYDANNERIGCREVRRLTGWHVRKVQRRSSQLGGEMIRGRLEFDAAAIAEHLAGADR